MEVAGQLIVYASIALTVALLIHYAFAGSPAEISVNQANRERALAMEDVTRKTVDSASDARTVNNTLRQEYRVLSEKEKELMARIKSCGQELLDIIAECGGSRELSIAKTKTEEAVMWAVKHVTA